LLQVGLLLTICTLTSKGGIIRQLIQDNLAGRPENFQVVSWKFDPDVAERRSVEFQDKFGVHGERLIA
ncbi:hypothetical protein C0J52_15078, partial [Blattella germanica]